MPTYDYLCHHCGHRFEVIHGVHADGPTTCPACGGAPVRKAISAPSIHFKGTGWAKKDRSTAARPAAADATGAADDSTDGVYDGTSGSSEGATDGAVASKAEDGSTATGAKPGTAAKPGAGAKPAGTDSPTKGSSPSGTAAAD